MPVERISPDERQRRDHARPSWGNLYSTMDQRTHNNPSQNDLLRDNRLLLRDYYDAVITSAKGSYRKMRKFKKEHQPNGQPTYHPELTLHMGMIRSAILGPRKPR